MSNKFLKPGKAHIDLTVTPSSATTPQPQPGRQAAGGQAGAPASGRQAGPPGPGGPARASEADVHLSINGESAGQAHFSSLGGRSSETLDIGSDSGSAVSLEYESPYRYTGNINTVEIELSR